MSAAATLISPVCIVVVGSGGTGSRLGARFGNKVEMDLQSKRK